MASTPGRAAQARMYVLRSATQILHIHSEAAPMGRLDPSWPQLKRVLTCGQILVLCCARGEVPALEAADLFQKLCHLIRVHADFWPMASRADQAYRDAATRLGEWVGIDCRLPLTNGQVCDFHTRHPLTSHRYRITWGSHCFPNSSFPTSSSPVALIFRGSSST